jgi:N utilization substance protein A
MEVIVGEDQLSLAIGKKGQNVRLATRLVGWEIKIVSEELLKQEIAKQMGRMMASGEAVPITALEGVTAPQAETLAEHGIEDVEALAAASVDDLVEFLDVSMDEAEKIKSSAQSIVAAKDAESEGEEVTAEAAEPTEPGAEDAVTEPAAESEEITEEVSEELSPEDAAEIVETQEAAPAEEDSASDIISETTKPEQANESPANETEEKTEE